MTDYIKREDAIKWLKNLFDDCGNYMPLWHYGEVLQKIIELLEADVAPVVRCEDCKYWIELEHGTGTCKRLDNVLFWLGTDATDFCSFAERKDNE